MKRVYLLFAVVAAQLIWLGWNYADRTREMAEAPVIHIECTDYDPRDLFRGDYVSIRTHQEVPLELAGASIYWGEKVCNSVNTYSRWNSDTCKHEPYPVSNPLPPRTAPDGSSVEIGDGLEHGYSGPGGTVTFLGISEQLAVYWKKEADGLHHVCRVEAPGSAQDSPAAGETRALMWGDIVSDFDIEKEGEKIISVKQKAKLRLSFSRNYWHRMRFYVEEGTGDVRRLWLNEIEGKDNVPFDKVRRTVDIVLRENAAVVPRMLYLNGVAYPEAIEQMRNKTFKWENSAE